MQRGTRFSRKHHERIFCQCGQRDLAFLREAMRCRQYDPHRLDCDVMELHARWRLTAETHESDVHTAVAEIGEQLCGVAFGKREGDVRIVLPIVANQLGYDRIERCGPRKADVELPDFATA